VKFYKSMIISLRSKVAQNMTFRISTFFQSGTDKIELWLDLALTNFASNYLFQFNRLL